MLSDGAHSNEEGVGDELVPVELAVTVHVSAPPPGQTPPPRPPPTMSAMRATGERHGLLQSMQEQVRSLTTRLAAVEERLQISPREELHPHRRAAAPLPMANAPAARGYMIKDIDSFAGFAHAIHTYLSGVALADLHERSLLYTPFRAAHGLEYGFDDFLSSDPRGLVPPLVAPRLSLRPADAQPLIDDRPVWLSEVSKGKVSAPPLERRHAHRHRPALMRESSLSAASSRRQRATLSSSSAHRTRRRWCGCARGASRLPCAARHGPDRQAARSEWAHTSA